MTPPTSSWVSSILRPWLLHLSSACSSIGPVWTVGSSPSEISLAWPDSCCLASRWYTHLLAFFASACTTVSWLQHSHLASLFSWTRNSKGRLTALSLRLWISAVLVRIILLNFQLRYDSYWYFSGVFPLAGWIADNHGFTWLCLFFAGLASIASVLSIVWNLMDVMHEEPVLNKKKE